MNQKIINYSPLIERDNSNLSKTGSGQPDLKAKITPVTDSNSKFNIPFSVQKHLSPALTVVDIEKKELFLIPKESIEDKIIFFKNKIKEDKGTKIRVQRSQKGEIAYQIDRISEKGQKIYLVDSQSGKKYSFSLDQFFKWVDKKKVSLNRESEKKKIIPIDALSTNAFDIENQEEKNGATEELTRIEKYKNWVYANPKRAALTAISLLATSYLTYYLSSTVTRVSIPDKELTKLVCENLPPLSTQKFTDVKAQLNPSMIDSSKTQFLFPSQLEDLLNFERKDCSEIDLILLSSLIQRSEVELENIRELQSSDKKGFLKKLSDEFLNINSSLITLKNQLQKGLHPHQFQLIGWSGIKQWKKKFEKANDDLSSSLLKLNDFKSEITKDLQKRSSLNPKLLSQESSLAKNYLYGSDKKTANRILLHVLGDTFGLNSSFEGNTQKNILEFFLTFFNAQEHHSETPLPYEKLKQLVLDAVDFEDAIFSSSINDSNTLTYRLETLRTKFQSLLIQKLEDRKVGESIIIPSGWSSPKAGHAMVLEIIKEDAKHVTLNIINTGSGLKYHPVRVKNFNEEVIPLVQKKNIPLEEITSSTFLRGLIETQVIREPRLIDEKNNDWGSREIYLSLVSNLPGKFVDFPADNDDFIEAQNSGTCAYRSLMALFRRHMSKEQYLRFEYEVEVSSINQYFYQFKNEISKDEISLNLLNKSAQFLSRKLLNTYDKNKILTDSDKSYTRLLISDIITFVKVEEAKISKTRSENAETIQWGALDKSLKTDSRSREFVSLPPTSRFYRDSDISNTKSVFHSNLNVDHFEPTRSSIISSLSNFEKIVTKAFKDQNYIAIEDFIISFYKKLPIPRTKEGNNLWGLLDKEERLKCSNYLVKLNELFFQSCFLIPGLDKGSPEQFNAMFKGMTIIYDLHRSDFERWEIKDRELSNKYFSLLNSIYYRNFSPFQDHEILELKKYWDFAKKGEYELAAISYSDPSHTVASNDWEGRNLIRRPLGFGHGSYDLLPIKNIIEEKPIFDHYKAKEIYFESKPFLEQLLTIYTDQNENVLPKQYYDYRKQKFMTHFFISGLFALPENFREGNDAFRIKYSWSKEYYFSDDHYSIESKLPVLKSLSSNIWRDSKIDKVNDFIQTHPEIKNENLKKIITKVWGNKEIQIGSYLGDFTCCTNLDKDLVTVDPKTHEVDFPLDEFREIIMLKEKPALQISRTLSFFQRNLELLKDSDYQILFSLLLFDPALLNTQLRESQNGLRLAKDLSEFIQRGFKFFLNLEDTQAIAFFLRINHTLKEYFDFNIPNNSINLLDTKYELKKLLSNAKFTRKEQAYFHAELAITNLNKKDLTDLETTELIENSFLFFIKNPLSNSSQKDPRLYQNIRRALLKHKNKINDLFSHPTQRNSLLNNLYKSATNRDLDKEWVVDPLFPQYKTTDGSIEISLLEGKLYENNGSLVALSDEILESATYRKLFGDKIHFANRINSNPYEFTDEHGLKNRIFKKYSDFGDLIYQQQLEPSSFQWAQYISSEELIIKDDKKITPKLGSLEITHDHSHWIEINDDRGIKTLWIKDKDFKTKYQVTFKNPGSYTGFAVSPVYKEFTVKDIKTGRTLSDIEETPFKFLKNVDDPSYIHIWKKPAESGYLNFLTTRDDQVGLIELLRFGLQFKVLANSKEAQCLNYPGFKIADKQDVPGLEHIKDFLLLENKEGQKKVLLPVRNLLKSKEASEKGSLFLSRPLDKSLEQFFEKQTYLTYDIDKFGNLNSKTLEGNIYLAFHKLVRHKYNEANFLLRTYCSSINEYSEEEIERLQWITDLSNLNADDDPKAIAIQLYSIFQITKNKELNALPPQELGKIDSLYSKYLKLIDEKTTVKLKKEEELYLLDLLLRKDLKNIAYINRLIQLDKEKANKLLTSFPLPIEATEEQFSSKISSYDFNAILEDLYETCYGKACASSQETPKKLVLRQKYESLKQNFLYNYKILRSRAYNEDQAKQIYDELKVIKEQIRSSKIDEKEKSGHIANLLMALYQNPGQFPQAREVESLVQRYFSLKEKYKRNWSYEDYRVVESKKEEISRKLTTPYNYLYTYNYLLSFLSPTNDFPVQSPSDPKPQLMGNPFESFPRSNGADSFAPASIPINLRSDLIVQPLHNEFPILNSAITSSTTLSDVFLEKELLSCFKIKDEKDLFYNRQMKEYLDDSQSYIENRENNLYLLKDITTLRAFKSSINLKIQNENDLLKQEKIKILTLANRCELDNCFLESYGTIRQDITMHDLSLILLRKDGALLKNKNPHLLDSEISGALNYTLDYLKRATYIQKLNRINSWVEKIQKERAKDTPNNLLIQQYTQSLMQEYSAKRAFSEVENPEYLVMEFYADIQLYQDQVDDLKLLLGQKHQSTASSGFVLEKICGSGKSSALLPLIALSQANGDSLSTVVMPKALTQSIGNELKDLMGESFELPVKSIVFDRNIGWNVDRLERIYDELQSIRENREVLLIDTKSIQTLLLKFIELNYSITNISSEEERVKVYDQIQITRKILKLLNAKALPIFDEVDLLFDSRHELHFTLGEADPIQGKYIDLVIEVYKLLSDSEILSKNPLEIFSNRDNQGSFSSSSYESIKPLFVSKLLSRLKKATIGKISKKINLYFQSLGNNEKHQITSYLLNQENGGYHFVNQIKDDDVKNILALAKQEINTLFPLTLSKNFKEHYGPSGDPDLKIAIPYHQGEPSKGSLFGNPYEILNYTLQQYLKNGISKEEIASIVLSLKRQAIKELQEEGSSEKSEKRFQKLLCPKKTKIDLFQYRPKDIDNITQYINSNLNNKLMIVKEFLLKDVKLFPNRLSANPQVFRYMFKNLLGFTGTLWNKDTYPLGISSQNQKGVIGKTISSLLKKSPKTLQSTNFSDYLETLGKHFSTSDNTYAFIDAGGVFREIENEIVAKTLLENLASLNKSSEIEGIIFYGNNNELMIYERKTRKIIPLSKSTISKENRLTYYDQRHSVGANIMQPVTAKAIMSIGRHTKLRDLIQASWRMRGLDKQQSIEFLLTNEDKQSILKSLNKKETESLSLKEIILFVTENQIQRLAEDNHHAIMQKMKSIIEENLFELLIDGNTPQEELSKLLHDLENIIFISSLKDEPFKQYGDFQSLRDKSEVINEEIKAFESQKLIETISSNGHLRKKLSRESLHKALQKAIDLNALPEKIASGETNSVKDTEVEQEVNVEQQVKIHLEIEQDLALSNVDLEPEKPWGILKSYSYVPSSTFNFDVYFSFFQNMPTLKSLNSCYSKSKNTNKLNEVFSPSLGVTSNFLRGEGIYKYNPLLYGKYQYKSKEFLIVNDRYNNFKILLLDALDAEEWKEFLTKTPNNLSYNEVYLFNIKGDIVTHTNSEESKVKALMDNPKFIDLKIQTKFANGELFYSKTEKVYLMDWLKKNDPQKMFELFYSTILKFRPHSQNLFKTSSIFECFKKLGVTFPTTK